MKDVFSVPVDLHSGKMETSLIHIAFAAYYIVQHCLFLTNRFQNLVCIVADQESEFPGSNNIFHMVSFPSFQYFFPQVILCFDFLHDIIS